MKIKTSILTAIFGSVLFIGTNSFAICKDEQGNVISGVNDNCAGAAGSTAVTAGSTLYSIKKFSDAKSVVAKNTKGLYDFTSSPKPLEPAMQGRIIPQISEGDLVTVNYELSEPESRKYLISAAESAASSSRSSADMHRMLAAQALVPKWETVTEYETETYTDSSGQLQSRSVPKTKQVYKGPDLASHMMHTQFANDADESARRSLREAARIRNGGAIDLVRLDEQLDTRKVNLSEWLAKEAKRDSKLVKLDNLPAEFARLATKMRVKGAIGIAGAVAGTAGAAYLGTKAYQDDEEQQRNEWRRSYETTTRPYRRTGTTN